MENMETAGMIAGSVEKWSADQLFADSFLDKIKSAVQPLVVRLQ